MRVWHHQNLDALSVNALLHTLASMPLPTDAVRLFHGRGGLHAGCEHWTLDFYPPVWVLTSFQPVPDEALATIGAALAARWEQLAPGQPLNWVFQTRLEGRADTRLMAGSVPDQHAVGEDGTRYFVHVLRGQNHGLFLDMAEGRRWVRALAAEKPRLKVLNLFAYTCAFSVVALQAGARQVVNVDMSHGALAIGQQNHRLNGVATGQVSCRTTSSAPGARSTAAAPTTSSSSIRPATRRAASWRARTTPGCCAACPTCSHRAATRCFA